MVVQLFNHSHLPPACREFKSYDAKTEKKTPNLGWTWWTYSETIQTDENCYVPLLETDSRTEPCVTESCTGEDSPEFRFFISGPFSWMNNATMMAKSTGNTPNRKGNPEKSLSCEKRGDSWVVRKQALQWRKLLIISLLPSSVPGSSL